jgi:hypothetical protein
MSRIAIKICGLSTPETLDAALKGGASHVGFVHFAKSPRHVDGDRLAQLAARVLRRPLCRRNADAADPRSGGGLQRGQDRPGLPGPRWTICSKHYVGRPSPLYFAERLTEHLGGAKIYFKRDELNHTGAHKINNCIGQILLAKRMGKTRIIAETGAGQHGVATATVCARFGLPCVVYMGATDVERQAPNVFRMKLLGAEVCPVTSARHAEGRDERGAARLGRQCRRHLLHASAPWPARIPIRRWCATSSRDRQGGARPDAGAGRGPPARRAGRLHRRRLERHRPVPPLPRRPERARSSASRRRATASTPAALPPR